ncbi:MAG: hypothetical protein M3N48_12570 [Verrucomicrobiota bacterium]|nr:hypothetical protein [Verrucomicrobiota bacterium]
MTEARLLIDRSRRELIEQLRGLVEKGHAQADRIDNALLTLNAGALLLSITFVGTLTTSKQCLSLLFIAWAAFILSMISVIFAMMRAQYQSHQSAVETANNLERFSQMDFVAAAQQRVTFPVGTQKTVASLNIVAFVGFIIGVAFLCFFVGINLSRDKRHGPTGPPPARNQAMQRTALRSDV